MGLEARLQLSAAERAIVEAILREHAAGVRVWVFGSRANGVARRFSDLDLGFEGPEPMTLAVKAELVEAFEESDLPFRVDVVDLVGVEVGFAERVRRTGVLLG